MADYVVNFAGKDNISDAAKSVEDGLKGIGDEAKKASKSLSDFARNDYKGRFEAITSSGKQLRTQIRQIKEVLADMDLDEAFDDKGLMTEIAQKAAEIQDAMDAATDSVKRFTGPTAALDAGVEAFEAGAAAMSVYTGAMGLLGAESEELDKLMLKAQASLTLLNGVQQIANILDKDSALMHQLKALKLKLATAWETKNTVETQKNTVAENVNTGAKAANSVATSANTGKIIASTAAQKSWNVAKAIGSALLGNVTGLILLGAAGLTAYAMAAGDADEKDKKRNKTLTDAQRILKERRENEAEMSKEVAASVSKQLGAYLMLQARWKECGKDITKQKKFLTEYKDKVKETGFSVTSLADCEKLFISNTAGVVKAIEARAKAQAAYNMMVKELEKGYEKLNKKTIKTGDFAKVATNENVTSSERSIARKELGDDAFTYKNTSDALGNAHKVEVGLSKKGLALIQKLRTDEAKQRKKNYESTVRQEMEDNVATYKKYYMQEVNEVEKIIKENGLKEAVTTTTKTSSTSKTAVDEQKRYAKELKAAQDSLNKGALTQLEYKQKIAAIEKTHFDNLTKAGNATKADAERYKNTLKEAMQAQVAYDTDKKRKEIQDRYNDGMLNAIEHAEALANLDKEIYEENRKIGTATKEMAQNYLNAKKHAEELKLGLDKGSIGEINKQISDLDDKLKNKALSLSARIEIETKKAELQRQLDKISQGDITIKANVEPTRSTQKGDLYDKRQSRSNAENNVNQIMGDYEAGIKSARQARAEIEEINAQLMAMGMKPIEVHIETKWEGIQEGFAQFETAIGGIDALYNSFDNLSKKIEEGANAWEMFIGVIQVAEGVMAAINTVMMITELLSGKSAAGKIAEAAASEGAALAATQEAAVSSAAVAPKVAETAANKALEASVLDLAAAEIFLAHAAIPFAGVGIATGLITTMMAAQAAQHAASLALVAFAEGGIVGGSASEHPILAHKGEMILNEQQQGKLFNAINNGNMGNNTGIAHVVGRVKGKDLELVLDNIQRSKSKAGINLKF